MLECCHSVKIFLKNWIYDKTSTFVADKTPIQPHILNPSDPPRQMFSFAGFQHDHV